MNQNELAEIERQLSWKYIILHKILPPFIAGFVLAWIIIHYIVGV